MPIPQIPFLSASGSPHSKNGPAGMGRPSAPVATATESREEPATPATTQPVTGASTFSPAGSSSGATTTSVPASMTPLPTGGVEIGLDESLPTTPVATPRRDGIPERVHLSNGGTSLLLDTSSEGMPVVLHWGAALGQGVERIPKSAWDLPIPPAVLDKRVPVSLLPERSAGYRLPPGLNGHRPVLNDFLNPRGVNAWSHFTLTEVKKVDQGSVRIVARDADAGLELQTDLTLTPAGLLRMKQTVRNEAETPYSLDKLSCVLPVPARANELMDYSGRWCLERQEQRRSFSEHGGITRDAVHGRPGHDSPLLMVAGKKGFGFRSGEVWGMHLAWSGDASYAAHRSADGRGVLSTAEHLEPGEIILAPGQSYSTPEVLAAYSPEGLDGITRTFHRELRARPEHPVRPRPVTLNTWEAVYFDQTLESLCELADAGAEIGVERFVLDDGWFKHRRNAKAGLGDWYVDPKVWSEGLKPLIDHVKSKGMEFGLWVEPEMINPDSDLFRAHPDWVMKGTVGPDGRLPVEGRVQQVLNLAHPDAYAYILERMDALLKENDISYLKWDHNRDLVEAGWLGKPAVHEQTQAFYRLLDELRARHPDVEIESCASGGGRVDAGVIQRTQRVWGSDSNDALDRQAIQRGTQTLLPPELIGAHIGPPTAHTTYRTQSLSFRATTALFGHMGIEWDIRNISDEERAALKGIVSYYKEKRGLLHSGETVRVDHFDPSAWVHGVVAQDKSEALFSFVQLTSSKNEVPGIVQFDGLDPNALYTVRPVYPAGKPEMKQRAEPTWMTEGGVTMSGEALMEIGLSMPLVCPEQALLLEFTRQ